MERQSQENGPAIQAAAIKIELIEGLQRALDRKYRQLLATARRDWERLFANKDRSDACVSVRIHAGELADKLGTLPGCGFLKPRNQPEAKNTTKQRQAQFAH